MTNKVIDLNESITVESINSIVKQISSYITTEDFNPESKILLIISSDGGNPNCLKHLEEFLKAKDIGINTMGIGRVASAAASLFMFGEERTLLNDSYLLLHEPCVPCLTNSITRTVLKNLLNEIKDVENVTFKNIYNKSYVTPRLLYSKISDGKVWKISAKRAMSLGLATTVI